MIGEQGDRVLRWILTLILLLPNVAFGTSYGPPMPSVSAEALASHLLVNLACGAYIILIILNCWSSIDGKEKVSIATRYATFVVIGLHAVGYLLRWKESYDYGWGHFPLSTFYEAVILFSVMLASAGLYLQIKTKRDIIGVFSLISVVAAILMANSTQTADISALYDPKYVYDVQQVLFAYKMLAIKYFLLSGGYSLIIAAGLLSLVQKVQTVVIKRSNELDSKFQVQETLYIVHKRFMIAGFLFLLAGLLSGLFASKYFWGQYWSWQPDELLAAIVCIFYTAFIARNTCYGWNSGAATNRSIIGLAIISSGYWTVHSFLYR
jgi:ABC-type transport system involved in cytochrome c biogenesis permease subunit